MNENPNLAVITSKQIIEQSMPILYVSHDEDGYWQFLSRFEKDENDGRVVRMEEILERDPTLGSLSVLQPGMEAYRTSASNEWIIGVKKPENDG